MFIQFARSARGDVETNGARVVVLEVLQVRVAAGLHLEADGLAGRAVEGRDGVRVAGGHGSYAVVGRT